jgi:tetratricopeptide (TPR) repeat protein
MNRRKPAATAAAVLLLLSIAAASWGRQQGGTAVVVEPAELGKRQDLVGREVVVDDRVAYYVTRGGTEDDELQLKRTPVTFRVPRRLRPAAGSRNSSVVVRGILERDGSRLSCRITGLEVKPPDVERLKAAVDHLGPRDYATRRAWARWAERRAAEFKDDALMRRAKALDVEALRMEGETKRVAVDAPGEWLAMARDARRRKVPEPEPSAQAHRAFRARLAAAADANALRALAREVEEFFPDAKGDQAAARTPLGGREREYLDDSAAGYRSAPAPIRKALDRRLWADVQYRLFDAEPISDLATAQSRSEQAAALLPERPDLPARLLEKGVAAVRRDLAGLRRDEVTALTDVYRTRMNRPDEALKVLREWLEAKKSRLSNTDAEGRVALAGLYEEMLEDRVTAVELLRKAWEIDPTSQETKEAFRNRGFRMARDEWVEAEPQGGPARPGDTPNPGRPAASSTQSLLGLTPEELREKLITKPSSRNYIATRGQLIEQRIYLDTDSVRYVNLLRTPGEPRPRVIADYTLPRRGRKGGPPVR